MILKRLKLLGFRNYSELDLSFKHRINVIYGENGQGKTNLLEAIYYLALTQSFRTNQDKECINYLGDVNSFDVLGQFESVHKGVETVRIYYSRKENKHLFINKLKQQKFKDHVGKIPVVLLKPDDLKLTFGSPTVRRKFLDILISQISGTYLDQLMRYQKAVKQKNTVLSNYPLDKSMIDIWNEALVTYAMQIIERRKEIISELNELVNRNYQLISGKSEVIELHYISNLSDTESKEAIFEKLQEFHPREHRQKRAIIGPHRDDLAFLINGKVVGDYGSQGENKTFLISLKLAELEIMSRYTNETPILLFDDIFSELDRGRVERLMEYVKEVGQIFITTTDKNLYRASDVNRVHVNRGDVVWEETGDTV